MALSKMTRGSSDARTSCIFALTGLALGCCPLLLVYMIIGLVMLFKAELVVMLTLTIGVNITCWVLIGLLLNLEFITDIVRFRSSYDVFIRCA